MNTLIGQQLRSSVWRRAVAILVFVSVIATDYLMTYRYRVAADVNLAAYAAHLEIMSKGMDEWTEVNRETFTATFEELRDTYATALRAYDAANLSRAYLSLATLFTLLALARGDRSSLGLVPVPTRGWLFWVRIGLIGSSIVLAIALPLGATWLLMGWEIHTNWDGKSDFGEAFRDAIIRAPIYEEIMYRVGICAPVAACWGPRWAIVVSGVLFGLIHVIGGNPNPVNLIAGYFFAWIFLKSNTILVPMILHFAGNLFFLYAQLFLMKLGFI